jgi:hypothetical protein
LKIESYFLYFLHNKSSITSSQKKAHNVDLAHFAMPHAILNTTHVQKQSFKVKRGVVRSKQIQEGEKYMREIEHRKTKTKRDRENMGERQRKHGLETMCTSSNQDDKRR